MKFKDRQASPPPAQAPVSLPPDEAVAADVPSPTEPPPAAPSSWLTVMPDRVQLTTPHIWLQGNVIVRDSKGGFSQTREFTPASAYIAQGMLVIEELGMIIPGTSVHIIRKEKP